MRKAFLQKSKLPTETHGEQFKTVFGSAPKCVISTYAIGQKRK